MRTMRNKVQLIGNLGKDPEVFNLEDGKMMAKFPLATTEVYRRQDGEQVKDTHWHNIVVWGPLAKSVAEKLAKGTEVFLEGKLRNRAWEDKSGQRKQTTEIHLNDYLVFRGKKVG